MPNRTKRCLTHSTVGIQATARGFRGFVGNKGRPERAAPTLRITMKKSEGVKPPRGKKRGFGGKESLCDGRAVENGAADILDRVEKMDEKIQQCHECNNVEEMHVYLMNIDSSDTMSEM